MPALQESHVPGYPCRRGKVRDVYDLGDRLVLVTTDRISAFDWVLPTAIPDKGKLLNQMTLFWLQHLGVPNHLISTDLAKMGPAFAAQSANLSGRTCLVHKTEVVPIECVARGFLAGSGWKEYRENGTVGSVRLPKGLKQAAELAEPIFTPATKETTGHDINISFEEMADRVGESMAGALRQKTLDIYRRAALYARSRGLILADTKLEWGQTPGGDILLIDELLTPDSSRYWDLKSYRPGSNPPSFDKQFVRDWLETTSWDKNSPPPELPAEVVQKTGGKYLEAYERITGRATSSQGKIPSVSAI
jgi:phosphoribosylaminoimidazole-succinocarboxamide synthase